MTLFVVSLVLLLLIMRDQRRAVTALEAGGKQRGTGRRSPRSPRAGRRLSQEAATEAAAAARATRARRPR